MAKNLIFISRFNPPTADHVSLISRAVEKFQPDNTHIIVTGYSQARNSKYPFVYHEIEDMFCLEESEILKNNKKENKKLIIRPLKDLYYNTSLWLSNLQNLLALKKEDENYFVRLGKEEDWHSIFDNIVDAYKDFGISTESKSNNFIQDLFSNGPWQSNLNKQVIDYIEYGFIKTNEFIELKKEYEFIKKYKEIWSSAPFPPTFVCTDAIVTCKGKILVVVRKGSPGKGLYALPGGFLNQEESTQDGCLRELKEETRIAVSKEELERNIIESKVFDYPFRSLRGRTITHASHIDLKLDRLPNVKGSDDAEKAKWIDFSFVLNNEDKFFEDHAQIISYFILSK